MNIKIKTTDISTIRPMFAQGAGENIKRYGQLKKLFEEGKEYQVFAEPIIAGENKITWNTDFAGQLISYDSLSDEEKETAKGRLKSQINKLYKTALNFAKANKENVGDLFEIIDSCIEIPDYNDIYMVKNYDKEKNFVIIRWGFTSDDFKAKTGLVKKLIPLKVTEILVRTVYTNNKSVGNQKIYFEFPNNNFETTSDERGRITFQDIPFFTKFQAYQLDNSGNKIHEHSFVCDSREIYYFQTGTPMQNMNIYVTDQFGNYISNAEFILEADGEKSVRKSDEYGRIILDNIAVGTEIVCSQEGGNKQQVTCKDGQSDYRIIGKPPIADMNFIVTGKLGNRLPNATISFEYEGIKTERVSDDNGVIILKNMPVGTEVVPSQLVNGMTITKSKHICQKNISEYNIIAEPPVTSGMMNFILVDSDDKPIKGCPVKFEYSGKEYERVTDEEGRIFIDNIPFGTTVKVAQITDGTVRQTISYTCIKNKAEYKILGHVKQTKPKVVDKFHDVTFLVTDLKENPISMIDFGTLIVADRNVGRTNQEGKISFPAVAEGTVISTNVYHEGKNYHNEFVVSSTENFFTIKVGEKRRPLWVWLIPIILLLGLLGFFLMPLISSLFIAPATDTTIIDTIHVIDTTKVIPVVQKGLTIIIKDENSLNPVDSAVVTFVINDKSFSGSTDVNGKINFPDADFPNQKIDLKVVATNYQITKKVFIFEKEKIIFLSNSDKSQDVSEIPLPCGQITSSGGFGTTIKVFNLGKANGSFKLFYQMWQIPDEMQVYAGKPSEMSPDKMLWSTNGLVSGAKNVHVTFVSPDSLITVKVSGTNNKTKWTYQVFCP